MQRYGWLVSVMVLSNTAGGLAQEKLPSTTVPAKSIASQTAARESDFRVIGHLEKADRWLTIKSGPKGIVYSVKNKEGKVLFENLSADQLRAQAPELHQLIKEGMAGGAKNSSIKADASLRHSR